MSHPAPDGPRPAGEIQAGNASTEPTLDEGALDAVLRATLDAADERATTEEIEALRAVARRHGAVPLVYDPVAVELVEAIIQVNYGQLRKPPEVWRSTSVRIAAVLFESPAARARLENLWAHLLESHADSADT